MEPTVIEYDDGNVAEELSEILVGRSIVSAMDNSLVLDDGTILRVQPNFGGCSCGAGDYDITAIAAFENVITRVEYVERTDDYNDVYEVFVYAATGPSTKVLAVEGDEGNGYYGAGYRILVEKS